MKIAVIGGNSFSGSNTISALLNEGIEVISFGRSKQIKIPFNPYIERVSKNNFKFVRADLNMDTKTIINSIKSFKPSVILNFAAQSMVAESWINPDHWYQTNIVSFSKLVKEVSKVSSLEKFIQFSTPEVYGNLPNWTSENFKFQPTTPYAISRAAADFHLKTLFDQRNFPVIFTRASNVFGPGQQLYRIVPKTILSAIEGSKIDLHGGGTSIRSFIYVRDVVEALMLIIFKGEIGKSYHISTNTLTTIKELVELISLKLNISFEELVKVVNDRPGKDEAYKLDSSFIRNSLNWKDKTKLSDGIDETIDWVDSNYKALVTYKRNYEHKK